MPDSDSAARELEAFEKELRKPLYGLLKIGITDSDKIPRQTKGNAWLAPFVEETDEDGNRNIAAYLPTDDPLDFLRISGQKDEFLSISWFAGKLPADFKLSHNNILARLKNVDCKTVQTDSNVYTGTAYMPFLLNGFQRPLAVEISLVEFKLQTRVSSVKLHVPADMYREWLHAWRGLSKWGEKDDKKDEKDEKKDGDAKSE